MQELGERQLAAYRYNMLSHRGEVSSFTVRMNRRAFPGCYDLLSRVGPCLPPPHQSDSERWRFLISSDWYSRQTRGALRDDRK